MNTPRPNQILSATTKKYPLLSKMVPHLLGLNKSKGWPDCCFLPTEGWATVIQAHCKLKKDLEYLESFRLGAVGAWRYSQGIYRPNPTFMKVLVESPILKKLPSDLLFRLPEWCVYVETPGLLWFGKPMFGFWAYIDYDLNTHNPNLNFVIDTDKGLTCAGFLIGPWSVVDMIEKSLAEFKRQNALSGFKIKDLDIGDVNEYAKNINPIISLLLYLCSEEPEIEDREFPGVFPGRPVFKKTKKGFRLFAPDKPKVWDVGAATGERIEKALSYPTGDSKRPHLRRAHWHGYWKGPKNQKTFIYKWLSPMFIGELEEEEIS